VRETGPGAILTDPQTDELRQFVSFEFAHGNK
jgi:hypothetical protein